MVERQAPKHMSLQDINRSSYDRLRKTARLGLKRAEAIRLRRLELGPFRTWDDLKQVPGMTSRTLNELRRHFKR
jgi:competence ComEA-like helix-hairpin-helix protein